MNDEERREIHRRTREHLQKLLQSSYEQYDKAILTLSGGGLALSIAFIKEIVPLDQASCKPLLLTSWAFFSVSILSTLISFLFSQNAIHRQIENADRMYGPERADPLTLKNPFSCLVAFLNWWAGAFFIAAIVVTIVFAGLNVSIRGEIEVNEKKAPRKVQIQEGYVPPKLQQTSSDETRGAVPPANQPPDPPAEKPLGTIPPSNQPAPPPQPKPASNPPDPAKPSPSKRD